MTEIVSVRGRPILPVSRAARVRLVDEPGENLIITAPELTVEVARNAVQTNSCVVTQGGNFACHGANLMRASRAKGGAIGWVSGVSLEAHQQAVITTAGVVTAITVASAAAVELDDLFEYQLGSQSWSAVCLWPHRVYNNAALALQLPGLSDCMSLLTGTQVQAFSRDGRIFFPRPSLTNGEILHLMLDDSSMRETWYERMRTDYDQILTWLSNSGATEERDALVKWARLFFSSLLPTHRTYAELLRLEAREAAATCREEGELLEKALRGPVVRWLAEEARFTDSSKRLDDGPWGNITPQLSATYLIHQLAAELSDDLPRSGMRRESLHRLASLATLKELKMAISKNLFALWGRTSISSV